tara:strand:- start:978 stop:1601 length:624 start_codon:yes stop_codon:yes gene_type:complete
MGVGASIQMNTEYFEHIGIFKDVYPEGYCQHLISEFNRLEEGGAGSNRQKSENASKHVKDDHQILIELRSHNLLPFGEQNPERLFFDGLQRCYDEYTNTYSILKDAGNIRATTMKMQRTGPGGGYHVWHGEQGPGAHANRVVVYMLYLNNITPEEGSETEFLYQKKRFSPTENTMVIWPAAYTHAHRGNPVLGETHKYIVTGWFYYD